LRCMDLSDRILLSIPSRWNPKRTGREVDILLSEEESQANEAALAKQEDVTFERRLTVDNKEDTMQIFTLKQQHMRLEPSEVRRTETQDNTRVVWTMSKSRPDKRNTTKTAAAVWFHPGDNRNTSFLVGGEGANLYRGEIMAIAEALRAAPIDQPLKIMCSSSQAIEHLTTKLRTLENKGWVAMKHGDIFRAAALWAKRRKAKTYFRVMTAAKQGQPESAIHEELDLCLAGDAQAVQGAHDAEDYSLEGAKLSGLMQSELYQHIVERKKKGGTRRSTGNMLNRIRADMLTATRGAPETEQIWKSIRNKDFSRAQCTFKWKTTHGAYKVRAYWRNILNHEQRASCPVCGEEESIEHILLECTSTTRRVIKKAERDLWRRRMNEPFPADDLGTRIGAGLIYFGGKRGSRKHKGLERFWRILQSETDQTLWTLRCKARIARGDRQEECHSIDKALNRWQSALERRMNLDRITADRKRFGKIATDRDLVRDTWKRVATRKGGDGNWIERGRVLVGTRQGQQQ
jgi:hypothetical protein